MGDRTANVGSRPTALQRRRLPWHEELVTCVLGTWLLTGLHLDGWAHRNTDLQDSLTTPWHFVLYSGWAVLASWIVWLIMRERDEGKRGLAAIPRGYALGLAGVISFAVGGAGDQIWHVFLGIEQDIEAFLSPTHWFLAVGMFLMVSCSFRAAWTSFDTDRPTLRTFAPTLWSITLTTAMIAFAYNYLSPFVLDNATIKDAELFALFRPEVPEAVKFGFAERLRMQGVGAEIVWTVLLMGMSLLMLRRWRPPFGSFIILFGATATATNAVWDFDQGWTIIAGLIGGLSADVLVRRLDPRPSRLIQYRVFAAVVPTVTWAAYFITVSIAYGMGWSTPMWAGSVTFAAPIGLLISALIVPMTIPMPPAAGELAEGQQGPDDQERLTGVGTARGLEGMAT
jgi:hypothetical protein